MSDNAGLTVDVVRRLHDTLAALHATPDLHASLQSICDSLYDLLDCQLVVIHLAELDYFAAVAHTGRRLGAEDIGQRHPVTAWRHLLDNCPSQGALTFCPDARVYLGPFPGSRSDDALPGDHEGAALDILVAPLMAGSELVGVVTVTMPPGQARIDELKVTMLEIFTLQAAVAIHQHRTAERAASDHVALRLSEERFRLAFDNAPIGVAEIMAGDDGPIIARINRAAGAMFGVSVAGARHEPVDQVLAATRGEPLSRLMADLLRAEIGTLRVEIPFVASEGGEFWGLVEAAAVDLAPGEAGALCQIVDITQAKAEERELTKLAQHDALTGLPNRLVIMDRLADAIIRAREQRVCGALLFCDLDNFKAVNDERGHLVGDDALAALATRLHSVVRAQDTAGRYGGDEFVVVSFPLQEQAAQILAERISESLSAPMEVDGVELRIGVSIGIAMISPGVTAAEVLKRADSAMYAVRSHRHRPLYVLDAG